MYFHLIWIKEKNWQQYELDFLITWWDESFIRDFLAKRWVVVVSLTEFQWNTEDFWNIELSLSYIDTEIKFLMSWKDLSERLYFIAYLWLAPKYINFVDKPIPEVQVLDLIKNTFLKIKEDSEKIKKQKEEEIIQEKKKYEEDNINDALDIINANIIRIQQVMKAWEGILPLSEIKQLEEYSNEMKKIRLWTNFNKMASLVLEAHTLVSKVEEKIFKTYKDQEFLIDKNSAITNIDIISECFKSNKISEKALFQPSWLTTTESIYNAIKPGSLFIKLLAHDFWHTLEASELDEILKTTFNFVEYIVLTATVAISILRIISWLFWVGNFSLYLLPAVWWLWILLFLFNSLIDSIKTNSIIKIIGFVVLALIYWRGLLLLLNTFAL